MPPFLTALDQATAPALVALVVAVFTYLLPVVKDLFLAWVASFRQPTWTALATTAVKWIEQTMAQAPSADKKSKAVAWAVGHGVPESLAGPLIEQAVHAMHAAATADLASQHVTTIQGITATTFLPADPLPAPAPPPPVSIVAQLLAEAPALEPLLAGFLSKPAPPPASSLIVPPGMATPVPGEVATST